MIRSSKAFALAACALLGAPAAATNISDATGDFLATYAGAHNGDLDILSASARIDGGNLLIGSTQNGAIGASAGSLFVWGVNRGSGTARLTLGSPSIGASILWDAVIVLFPDGNSRVVTFGPSGPPVITPLSGAVTINGDSISAVIPLALLGSTGYTPENYMFTLWSRLRVNPAADGTNAEIADFAPDFAGIRASVPEPASWAMMIAGFAAIGGALRRRRDGPVPA